MKNWLYRRLWSPLLGLLRQGMSPERLALCLAIGIVIGNIPILGIATILCTVIALVWRLNLPAIQLVQWLMTPTQPFLIIPYVRLGEWLAGAPRQPLSIKAGMALLAQDVGSMVHELWDAVLHAGLAFILVAPPAIFLLYRLLTPWLRHVARGLKRGPPAAETAL